MKVFKVLSYIIASPFAILPVVSLLDQIPEGGPYTFDWRVFLIGVFVLLPYHIVETIMEARHKSGDAK